MPRFLINDSGQPFDEGELSALTLELSGLSKQQREKYRDDNVAAISAHAVERMLIVAGPGTGKSFLFKRRILTWLQKKPDARVLALSFVRKLVADLNSDIQGDTTLSDAQKKQIDVHTLHKYARSLVEQNHGTKQWKFAPHFRIIGQEWKDIVWGDVTALSDLVEKAEYSRKLFENQLYDDVFEETDEWQQLHDLYFRLCQYLNAAGFADLILRARDALSENPALNQHEHFIFDEYQDFNAAEEQLLEQITAKAAAYLLVGDDDQVLYERLKAAKTSLIRAIYRDPDVVNAMLPFCVRCDFHITTAAGQFIAGNADAECIKKIYLPIADPEGCQKIQVVGCAASSTAVDYIRKFIEDHTAEIEQRAKDLADGSKKDAYLLILSPWRSPDFYKSNNAKDQLLELIEPYQQGRSTYSDDYYRLLNYYALARYPRDNFNFRKVLTHERVTQDAVLKLLKIGLETGTPLCELSETCIAEALEKAKAVRVAVQANSLPLEKAKALAQLITVEDQRVLAKEIERTAIGDDSLAALEHEEEEAAERAELEVKQMAAVELMTIVGSKGLSAEHVIVIGCDNVNLRSTANAFYVAMTRARKSLHFITALKSGGAKRLHDFVLRLPEANLDCVRYKKGDRKTEAFVDRAALIGWLRNLNENQTKFRR